MSARVVLGSAEVQIGAPAVRSPFPNPPLSSQHPWLPQTLPSRTGSCGRSALRPAVPRGDRRPVPLPSVDASPETATAPDHRRGVPSHVTRPLCPAHGLRSGTVGETQDSPPTGRCAARTAPAASPRPRVQTRTRTSRPLPPFCTVTEFEGNGASDALVAGGRHAVAAVFIPGRCPSRGSWHLLF